MGYEWARAGTRSGVTIPAQIRGIAMLEPWLKCSLDGLNSDPMTPGSAPNHRLVSVRLGPLKLNAAASIHIGLFSRDAIAKGGEGWWCEKALAKDVTSECT